MIRAIILRPNGCYEFRMLSSLPYQEAVMQGIGDFIGKPEMITEPPEIKKIFFEEIAWDRTKGVVILMQIP